MDDQKRLESKVDLIVTRIGSIDVTLGRQNLTLEEHVRRTENLEAELAPIKSKISMVEGGIKAIGALAIVIGLIEAVHSLMR